MDVNGPFYEPATKLAREAVEHDEKRELPQAIGKYERAVEYIIKGVKFDQLKDRAELYAAQAQRYLDRIQALKDVQSAEPHAGGGAGAAATASRKPGEPGAGDDGESGKLKGALSGAIVSEKPNVKWDDVAGLEGAKEALKEAVILPVRFPQLFVGNRKPWKGILLYGPPGTGKSFLAKAVATEAQGTFFAVSSSDLVSKWQGESEKLVRSLFELAREKKPAIVFIDEIDSMCGERGQGSESESARRIKTEFLVQMQGVSNNMDGVLVLAATNVPWEIDPAMRRRFEKRIYIPLPEAPARGKMFGVHLGTTPHNLTPADFAELGRASEGMSGSDISVVVREALMEPLRKCRTARYFRPVRHVEPSGAVSAKWEPVDADPPCSHCTPDLATRPAPHRVQCRSCGCARIDLMELGSDELKVPDVSMADFLTIMPKARGSVAGRELERYAEWTREFGSEGS